MKGRKGGRRPKANPPPPVSGLKGRAISNPKLGAQGRKLLSKHYANKYRTMRRG
jgi:hypothetical protein